MPERKQSSLGRLIHKSRVSAQLSQADLAGVELSVGYIEAVERGRVMPSRCVLTLLAERLSLPLDPLVRELAADRVTAKSLDLISIEAVEEDLQYQINLAKMLIRSGQLEDAMHLVEEAERYAAPHEARLTPAVCYLLPLTRARIAIALTGDASALPLLDDALAIALRDQTPRGLEAQARVRNMLGAAYYALEQPQKALAEHLKCLRIVQEGAVRDLQFKLAVYRNLANAYWALRMLAQAIDAYKSALQLLEDVDDPKQRAGVLWGLSVVALDAQEYTEGRVCATMALRIYEERGEKPEAASMCLLCAEASIGEERFDEAESMLNKAEAWLARSGNVGLYSFLYRYRGELNLKQGKLDDAGEMAALAVKYARLFLGLEEVQDAGGGQEEKDEEVPSRLGEAGKAVASATPASSASSANPTGLDPIRTYADALFVAGLVESARGEYGAADALFDEAMEQAGRTGITELINRICLGYAQALHARGAHEKANRYYLLGTS